MPSTVKAAESGRIRTNLSKERLNWQNCVLRRGCCVSRQFRRSLDQKILTPVVCDHVVDKLIRM